MEREREGEREGEGYFKSGEWEATEGFGVF